MQLVSEPVHPNLSVCRISPLRETFSLRKLLSAEPDAISVCIHGISLACSSSRRFKRLRMSSSGGVPGRTEGASRGGAIFLPTRVGIVPM
nr:hypothetical protein Iba_chr04fCG9010 [Ipomoea batatas]